MEHRRGAGGRVRARARLPRCCWRSPRWPFSAAAPEEAHVATALVYDIAAALAKPGGPQAVLLRRSIG